ncbi:MAG: hypothetical protein NTX65_05970 [Ignavibacteriales bacterium]|nr:hypothetical protein [Ignavibacteriales bacterium]
MRRNVFGFVFFLIIYLSSSGAQSIITPDIKTILNGEGWKGKFVSAELAKKESSDALMITKTEGDQFIWLDNFNFAYGIIEFDAKGKSSPPQSSFVGIAFRVVDEKTYDAIYFRPFNFRSTNPANKSHAVQYTSNPEWTWNRLRNNHNGEYEKGIEPAPNGDEWFHAKIEIMNREIKVYVNNADDPSLVVKELSNRKDGSVGLWCNGFGIIANLKIIKQID